MIGGDHHDDYYDDDGCGRWWIMDHGIRSNLCAHFCGWFPANVHDGDDPNQGRFPSSKYFTVFFHALFPKGWKIDYTLEFVAVQTSVSSWLRRTIWGTAAGELLQRTSDEYSPLADRPFHDSCLEEMCGFLRFRGFVTWFLLVARMARNIWWFPEIGIPLNHPFIDGFSIYIWIIYYPIEWDFSL